MIQSNNISYKFLLIIFFSFYFFEGSAQKKVVVNQHLLSFVAKKKWLQLPIKNKGKKRNLEIRTEGIVLHNIAVELSEEQPDWYAYIDLSKHKGKTIDLWVDSISHNKSSYSGLVQVDRKNKIDQLYEEKYRSQFHFSVKQGWNNDPNGMVYYNGEYHLFYQYNPYGRQWGNMHWGHAVSKDLVKWKELDIALFPDSTGMMYSGGGVVDLKHTGNFGTKKQGEMVLFYTSAGPKRTQGIAYSIDGREFKKLSKPVLGQIRPGNRDPKVIWHEQTKKWVMVLYVAGIGEQHNMHFLSSTNLIDWKPESIFQGGKGADRYLYECPEFYELQVEGSQNQKKWILVGADGQYAIGNFDGTKFVAEQERLQSVIGKGYYAGQHFSNAPNGRKIEMGWYRTNTDQVNMNFSQSMSIPMEISLIATNDGLRLSRKPVAELQSLRKIPFLFSNLVIDEKSPNHFKDVKEELMEIQAVLIPKLNGKFYFKIRGIEFSYFSNTGELSYKEHKVKIPLKNGKLHLHLFVDKGGVELFGGDGEVFVPAANNLNPANRSLSFKIESGSLIVESLIIHPLKSIWEK